LLLFLLEEEDRAVVCLVLEVDFLAAVLVAVPRDFLPAVLDAAFFFAAPGAGAEPVTRPAKAADSTIGRASLNTRQLQAITHRGEVVRPRRRTGICPPGLIAG